MDTRILIGYMLKQGGVCTFLEAMQYFEEVHPSVFRHTWDTALWYRQIGILELDRVPYFTRGMVTYSVPREPHDRWSLWWFPRHQLFNRSR